MTVFVFDYDPPPASVGQLIELAGCQVVIRNKDESFQFLPKPFFMLMTDKNLQTALKNCMYDLARVAALSVEGDINMHTLRKLEAQILETRIKHPDHFDDPVKFWMTVTTLGALAGELISQLIPGDWGPSGISSPPIGIYAELDGLEYSVNVLGKAKKLIWDGEGDSLVGLVETTPAQWRFALDKAHGKQNDT